MAYSKKIDADPKIVEWIDYATEKLDIYEVNRNEFLAEYKLPAKNLFFYKDLILPFIENTLLMDNIAASEGIEFKQKVGEVKNRLVLQVFIDGIAINATYPFLKGYSPKNGISNDEKPVQYPGNYPYLVASDWDGKNGGLMEAFMVKDVHAADKAKTIEDKEICICSEHSFYSILENFIRNSAKHNKQQLVEKDLIIFIHLDNFRSSHNDTDANSFYSLTLYDNVSKVNFRKVMEFDESINGSFLDETGEPKRKHLGIADMKINAHLLQSMEDVSDENLRNSLDIVVFDRNEKPENINFEKLFCFCRDITEKDTISHNHAEIAEKIVEKLNLKNVQYQGPSKGGSEGIYENGQRETELGFGYHFKISKPKDIYWIGKPAKNELTQYGIECYDSLHSFLDSKKKRLGACQFAIIEPYVFEEWLANTSQNIEDVLVHLPFRILYNGNPNEAPKELKDLLEQRRMQNVEVVFDLPQSINADFKQNLLIKCWKAWLKRWEVCKDKPLAIIINQESKPSWFGDKPVERIDNDEFSIIYSYGEYLASYPLNGFSKFAMFDHHGGAFGAVAKEFGDKLIFYSILGKNNDDHRLLLDVSPQMFDEVFFYRLIEICLLKVAIVDERLCEAALEKISDEDANVIAGITKNLFGRWFPVGGDAYTRQRMLLISRIFCATTFLGKEVFKMENETCDINVTNDFLKGVYGIEHNTDKTKIKNKETDFDILIVHRTYFDSNSTDLQKTIKAIKKSCLSLFITSGGGSPHSLQVDMKFIPFSVLNKNIGSYISKINLVLKAFT